MDVQQMLCVKEVIMRKLTKDGYYTNNHSCFLLQYHMILVTKFRKPVLDGPVKEHVYSTIRKTLEEKHVILNEINGEPDHIHMLITCGPELSPLEIANVLKTRTARFVWRDMPDEVSRTYWNTERHFFWSKSYFVSTVGAVNEEAVKRYIQNQGND